MPLDRSVLEADLELVRGLLHQVARRESSDAVVEAVSTLSKLLAERAGADVTEVQARLLALLAAEGLLPGRAARRAPTPGCDRGAEFAGLPPLLPGGD